MATTTSNKNINTDTSSPNIKKVLQQIKEKCESNTPLSNRATFPKNKEPRQKEHQKRNTDFFDFSLDTVRFRFRLKPEEFESYTWRIISETKKFFYDNCQEIDTELMEERFISYICENVNQQRFEAVFQGDAYICFLEFSLPKFYFESNCCKATFDHLWHFYDSQIKPYISDENEVFLNRIDFATNFSFESIEQFENFEKFLRTVKIGNSREESDKNFCFWKFDNRCVRFYNKLQEVKDKTTIDKTNRQAYLTELYRQEKEKEYCQSNNIGRLEFEFKKDWLDRKFNSGRSTKFEKCFENIKKFDWLTQFEKDFPFLFQEKAIINDSLTKDCQIFIQLASCRNYSEYLEFLYLAQRNGLDCAYQYFKFKKGKNFNYFENRFKELTGFTFEQALQPQEKEVFFPKKIKWLFPYAFYTFASDEVFMEFVVENEFVDKQIKKNKKKIATRRNKFIKKYLKEEFDNV